MQNFLIDFALRELARLALFSAMKRRIGGRDLGHDVRLITERELIVSVSIAWPGLDWSSEANIREVSIQYAKTSFLLEWSVVPAIPKNSMENGREAKYGQPIGLLDHSMGPDGQWSHFVCPAIYGVWLQNAVIQGYRIPAYEPTEPTVS